MGRFGALVALLAAVLALAACGDDEERANGEADAASAEEASPALPEGLAQRLRSEVLIEQQGLTTSEANCAIERLGETLSADRVAEAEDAAELPPDIRTAAFDAGVRCAGR